MKGEDGTLSSKIVHQHLGLVDIQRILRHALWVPVGFLILGGNDTGLWLVLGSLRKRIICFAQWPQRTPGLLEETVRHFGQTSQDKHL